MNPEIRRFSDYEALSRAAAAYVCGLCEESTEEDRFFSIVLAGGSTPTGLYRHLAGSPLRSRIPWPRIHLFWGDERCVPPDHPDSNSGTAYAVLITQVPVPVPNIHRIPGELPTPQEAADSYEEALHRFFTPGRGLTRVGSNFFPAFDLIILGVGKDGHTASLFPDDPVLEERTRWVATVATPRGSPPVPRVTLTLPVINQARGVMFLVSGVEKRGVVHAILKDHEKASRSYPAARVEPRGRLVWFVDHAALPEDS